MEHVVVGHSTLTPRPVIFRTAMHVVANLKSEKRTMDSFLDIFAQSVGQLKRNALAQKLKGKHCFSWEIINFFLIHTHGYLYNHENVYIHWNIFIKYAWYLIIYLTFQIKIVRRSSDSWPPNKQCSPSTNWGLSMVRFPSYKLHN